MQARPVHPRPIRDGLFAADDQGKPYLCGGRCGACGRLQFPMAPTCPECGAAQVEDVQLADHGTLWGWTAVTAPPPGHLGEVPFGFGVVELADGLRVVTRIEEPDPSRLEFGMPMQLALVELAAPDADGPVTTYTFVPTSPNALAPSATVSVAQRANAREGGAP